MWDLRFYHCGEYDVALLRVIPSGFAARYGRFGDTSPSSTLVTAPKMETVCFSETFVSAYKTEPGRTTST
jgi:hypothetical protein